MDKKDKFGFYAYLSRMKYINRWGLMKNTQPENIQEHSFQVAIIAHALGMINNTYLNGDIDANYLAVLSLFHDSSEIITGDMPTPIKYFNPDISAAFKKVEDIANEKLLSMLPDELNENYKDLFFQTKENEIYWKFVKAADKISAYIKCMEEEKSGNTEFIKAKQALYEVIVNIELPEVKYFMDNFISAYGLSLDEID
jgi:5'-deoxynucleotidase